MIVLLFYLENHIARNKKDNLTKKKDKNNHESRHISFYFLFIISSDNKLTFRILSKKLKFEPAVAPTCP